MEGFIKLCGRWVKATKEKNVKVSEGINTFFVHQPKKFYNISDLLDVSDWPSYESGKCEVEINGEQIELDFKVEYKVEEVEGTYDCFFDGPGLTGLYEDVVITKLELTYNGQKFDTSFIREYVYKGICNELV